MIDYGKRNLLGVHIDALDLEAALERIVFAAVQHQPYAVSALAVHGVVESHRDPHLRAALDDFEVVLPDGQPVRWALNTIYGLDLPDKVPGPTVTEALLDWSAEAGEAVFFYGSTPQTLERIETVVDQRWGPSLRRFYEPSRFGRVDQCQARDIAESINRSGASVCFVGLGCPRQERFVATVAPWLRMPALAVGAAFDYLAGDIKRAPAWIQRAGLEWAFRVSQDPRRLIGRYVSTNSVFMAAVAEQVVRQRLMRKGEAAPVNDGIEDFPGEPIDRRELVDA